jgi:acetolactate synthase-1/2/3 large subunit
MGMHGWKHVNRAIQSSDLLIGIGMRYDDRVTGNVRTFAPSAKIVHIDIDPAEIGKNVVADIPIVGDAKRVLEALLPMTERVDPAARATYFTELAAWRTESESSAWHGSGGWRDGVLSADFVVERIAAGSGYDANLTADVGSSVQIRTSHRVASARWASPSPPQWVRRLARQKRFRGRSLVTAVSR